jgi:hypothetical protein
MANNKTVKLEMRMTPELKELCEFMALESPERTISGFMEAILLTEALRQATFRQSVQEKLDAILPKRQQEGIFNDLRHWWELFLKKK